jgi:hypothetical protein
MSATDESGQGPRVPTEHPDPEAAGRKPEKGEDRPGFDLGGSSEEGRLGPTETRPGGPQGSPEIGSTRGGPAGSGGGGSSR